MSKPMRITPKRAAAAMLERSLSVAIDSMFEDPDSLVYYGVSEEDRALIAEQMHKIASPFLDRLHWLGALEVDLEESLMAPGGPFDRYDDPAMYADWHPFKGGV